MGGGHGGDSAARGSGAGRGGRTLAAAAEGERAAMGARAAGRLCWGRSRARPSGAAGLRWREGGRERGTGSEPPCSPLKPPGRSEGSRPCGPLLGAAGGGAGGAGGSARCRVSPRPVRGARAVPRWPVGAGARAERLKVPHQE